eukprot:TRINITY_DN10917_c0_g1_i1.p1 TRINITY_DN10917_c0_g1~~TRINITY_DN10917_c0_g1_i1.p1  ORF type:complete len:414 (+),score=75.66 TRINITY_DN10917_c0_g1_i1:1453-2694(+)
MTDTLVKIPPHHYIHVLDNNTNVCKLLTGPLTYLCEDQESLLLEPRKMMIVPPGQYLVVENPVCLVTNAAGEKVPEVDEHGQVVLHYGESEIRLETSQPFPFYPGEKMEGNLRALTIVEEDSALILVALRDFTDRYGKKKQRRAGAQWLVVGPCTYYPQTEVRVVKARKAVMVKLGEALKLKAKKDKVDTDGIARKAGEEWLYKRQGAYIPAVDEEIVTTVVPHVLLPKIALHFSTKHEFVDHFGVKRLPGNEWLVTHDMTEVHLPHVFETLVKVVHMTVLNKRQYAVILNPVEDGAIQHGKRKLIRGEKTFFLQPGESLERTAQVNVLTAKEALEVQAAERFVDEGRTTRVPGERWLICGPKEYWPPLEVQVNKKITAYLSLGDSLNLFQPDYAIATAVFVLLLAIFYLFLF